MAEGDKTLKPDDAADVLEELLDAQNRSRYIGLKLRVPQHVVDGTYSQPCDHLYSVIMEYLKKVEPRPTWRAIVDALKSPLVNFPNLAQKIERKYCLPASPQQATPPPASESLPRLPTDAPAVAAATHLVASVVGTQQTSPVPQPVVATSPSMPSRDTTSRQLEDSASVQFIQAEIQGFSDRFNDLKLAARECLKKRNISIGKIADALTSLPADDMDEHKVFLKSNIADLYHAADHSVLFGTLSFYWNYLSYQLLDYLIVKFSLEEVKGQMETYRHDLQQFRRQIPLKLFCQSQKRRRVDPPPGFRKVVVEHHWPDIVTLEVVESFRQEFACHYSLRECAMMLVYLEIGSFLITWFVPESIVKLLSVKMAEEFFEKHSVRKLEIAGVCVYQTIDHHRVPSLPPSASGSKWTSTEATAEHVASPHPSSRGKVESGVAIATEQEYRFVKQPSEDFFCPVTKELLLQPHLTTCCGHHLSDEATIRIQGGGGACPMCKATNWSTILDKRFYRQVRELRVFCRHKERGCGWEGELSTLEHHDDSCLWKNSPIQTVLTVQCHTQRKRAPREMMRGSVSTDHNFTYFTPYDSNSVLRYTVSEDKWEELPPCPYCDSGLAIIDGVLTAVGGKEGYRRFTNKLVTLRKSQWVEEYPPMNTPRPSPAVVSTISNGRCIIIVVGGYGDGRSSDCVELFNTESRIWSQLTSLPQPLTRPSITICGNRLYVIGGDVVGYSCSLQALLSSDQQISSQSTSFPLRWTILPRLPVTHSTAATLCEQLVIVGGMELGLLAVNAIHQLMDGQWVKIGSMSSGRWLCLVVSQSPDQMMMVGGAGARNCVEMCIVV